jgi:hypothetical protein
MGSDRHDEDARHALTKEELLDAASVAAGKRGWSSEGLEIVYDENNAVFNYFFFSAWRMPELDGREYRTVIYRTGRSRPRRSLWISVDKYTGEVLQVFEAPGYDASLGTTGTQTTEVRSQTANRAGKTNAGRRTLSREQIIDAAEAAAAEHSWGPDKCYAVYDEGNAIWKFCWPAHDRELEGCSYQAVIFKRRVIIPGGDLFVVVDSKTGDILTVQQTE